MVFQKCSIISFGFRLLHVTFFFICARIFFSSIHFFFFGFLSCLNLLFFFFFFHCLINDLCLNTSVMFVCVYMCCCCSNMKWKQWNEREQKWLNRLWFFVGVCVIVVGVRLWKWWIRLLNWKKKEKNTVGSACVDFLLLLNTLI